MVSSPLAYGLDPGRRVSQYVGTTWGTAQGLPDQAVRVLIQDQLGYLWLGTSAGLVRFDGVRFETLDVFNSGLQHPAVQALAEDREGTLWIGTAAGGLHWMRPGGEVRPVAGISGAVIRIAAAPDGGVWAGTHEGLFRLRLQGDRTETLGHWTVTQGLHDNQVLYVESDGSLLIGTARGVNRLREGRLIEDLHPQLREPVRDLLRRADGTLWIAGGSRVLQLGADNVLVEQLPGSWESSLPHDLLEDPQGQLWVASYGLGLIRIGPQGTETRGGAGYVDRRMWTLLLDRQGGLWAGTRSGLLRLRDGPVVRWSLDQGLADRHVRGLWADPDGSVWAAHLRGISRISSGRVDNWVGRDGLPEAVHRALWRDDAGRLWAGGERGLSIEVSPGRFKQLTVADGLPADNVKVLAPDGRGVWIGLVGGVGRVENDQASSPEALLPLKRASIEALLSTREGTLWIGTLEDGFWRFREGVLQAIELRVGARIGVRSLFEDSEGRLWIGTVSDGLYLLHQGRLRHLGLAQGLPILGVWSILPDPGGSVWFSSDRGILRFDRAALLAAAEPGGLPITPTVWLTESQGMENRECNGGGSQSALITADGRLWFATAGGVAEVHPEYLRPANAPIQTLIEGIGPASTGRLSAPQTSWIGDQRSLELRYTALDLADAESLRFRYRMVGVDAGWTEAGSRRSAWYTNLPPGPYQFDVQARRDRDTDWGPLQSVALSIPPHWHEHAASRGLGLLLFGLALFSGYRWRLAGQRRLAAHLQAEIELRTAELRAANCELARIAALDGLTGLLTSREFWTRLRRRLSMASPSEPVAVILFDVDDFKAYNDSFGHLQGDTCLRHVAEVLRRCMGTADGDVARYGGEEFVMALSRCERLQALAVARQVAGQIEAMALAAGIGARHAVVTVSVGVAVADQQADEQHFVGLADAALYRAKSSGRNRVEMAGALQPDVTR